MLKTITNYYEYTSQDPIKLVKVNLSKHGRKKKLDIANPDLTSAILEEDMTDFWKWNSKYKNLIQNTMYNKHSNILILNRVAEKWKLHHKINTHELIEVDEIEALKYLPKWKHVTEWRDNDKDSASTNP